MPVYVRKADGTREPYDERKLRRSLKKAGATKKELEEITRAIEKTLYDDIKTEVIYREAFELLRESPGTKASRYSLRRALFSLGPTGFPFEDFLARLLATEGYKARTRIELRGKCVSHEVDVVAYKKGHCALVEAKFHVRPGAKSDIQDVMYSYARFLDLQYKKVDQSDTCGIKEGIIATNTKFTKTAITYANCVGLSLLSWGYPKDNSLQERIERAGIYPVTALTSLSRKQKQLLITKGVVLCGELVDNTDLLLSIGCPRVKIDKILEETRALCTKK